MDHGHGGHGGGDMDMGPTCSMHMLWNTQIEDTCIVFRQWHISSHFIFVLSFIAIILISLGYEYLRAYQRSVDRRIAQALSRGKGRDRSAVTSQEAFILHGTILPQGFTRRAVWLSSLCVVLFDARFHDL
ncbi:Ctr copper transporter family-domain-containing protein [Russula vinacea]|nr:Ctr copper transporter family-domain-containing protein [Russula vinacea]